MTGIIPYKNRIPKLHESVFLADGVNAIGDVEIEEHCSICLML